jgi:hypothetical protein
MKPRLIVAAALLFFVGFSLATIVVKETRSAPTLVVAVASEPSAPAKVSATVETQEQVHYVVYYFHGNVRCKTCTAIENQSHDVITTMFSDQLGSGELEWRLVNYDTPENAHFRDDFQLAFQSVVLAEERDGRIIRWENLADVWTKIHESPREFEQYVVDRTATFMAGVAR